MPETAQKDLIARFRSGESLEYQRALAELTTHAALKRQGYTIEVHPEARGTERKPDFLVKDEKGNKVAYVEVTTFGPARELVGQKKRAAAVYNGVDQTKVSAGRRLGLDILKTGKQTPSLKKLRAEIQTWERSVKTIDPNDPPAKLFEIDDWKIEVLLFGGFAEDTVPTHAIASAMGDMRRVNADREIREALSDKGKRYGSLDAPYVIVIADCKEELVGCDRNGTALLDAVFGTVVTEVRVRADGQQDVNDVHQPDGYWGLPGKPKHQNVSGVVLLPKPHLWDLRDDRWKPLHLRNPWAEKPAPAELLPLAGFAVGEDGIITATEGTPLADILDLPKEWPPAG